jgi:hypothetical protein
MKFIVYQSSKQPGVFVVTDAEHQDTVREKLGAEFEKLGEYPEMGKERIAFDETLAKNSIGHQGYYRFEAKSFAPVPESPEMP